MIFKTKKYWIGVAAVWVPWAMLSIVVYLFAIQPQQQRYKIVHDQFVRSNDQVSVARMAAQEETKQRQAKLLADLQTRITDFMVPEEQRDRVVFEISRLANSFGLVDYAGKNREEVWNAYEGEQEVKIQRIWMTITFRAPFQQFAAFINAMERSTPAVFIESADFERSRDNPNQHRAKLLIAFFTKPAAAASDASVSAVSEKTREGSSS